MPQAELWMGAYPGFSSNVVFAHRRESLNELIHAAPVHVLGERVVAEYGSDLPFLFKLLAAERPLAIQAHPNLQQAQHGYHNEENAGTPLDSPERCFRDQNHKPEIICALSDFHLLVGLRPATEIVNRIERIDSTVLERARSAIQRDPTGEGVLRALKDIYDAPEASLRRSIDRVVEYATNVKNQQSDWKWIPRMHHFYPYDVGILVSIFMNITSLRPGQAVYVPETRLHAFLEGTGVELQANSNNVLRGGLTSGYVDSGRLLEVADATCASPELLEPNRVSDTEWAYEAPVREFRLAQIHVGPKLGHIEHELSSIEILLCVEGEAEIETASHESITIRKGQSVVIAAAVASYQVRGEAVFYKASTF